MSDSIDVTTRCPVCYGVRWHIFLELPPLPVYCNRLWSSRDAALQAPRGDIRLGFCQECGHTFNAAFDPARLTYTQGYDNSLHFSPRFQQYAEDLAEQLVERYGLYEKDIIEIGCGKGDFLRLLCELGNNRGLGFDPSYVPEQGSSDDRIRFIQDLYSDRYSGYKADFICCRHVLEHIRSPREFLSGIRQTIGEQRQTNVFFEVPNALFTLKDLSIWDIIYEHCGYFSPCSLAHAFSASGFEVKAIQDAFEGQFLQLETYPADTQRLFENTWCKHLTGLAEYASTFNTTFQKKIRSWRQNMDVMVQERRKSVIWGAGSKGVMFLNMLNIDFQIDYAVDLNPHKHGKYIAGTGQQIVPPEFLKTYQPDTILVMNPIYLHEIQQLTRAMHISSTCITV